MRINAVLKPTLVIPAKAGIQAAAVPGPGSVRTPAFAGVTEVRDGR